MDAAIAIYRRLGFRETEPFGDFHNEATIFLAHAVPAAATPAGPGQTRAA